MDGWKTIRSFWEVPFSGGYVCFRGGLIQNRYQKDDILRKEKKITAFEAAKVMEVLGVRSDDFFPDFNWVFFLGSVWAFQRCNYASLSFFWLLASLKVWCFGGWEMILSFWGSSSFQRRTVSFRVLPGVLLGMRGHELNLFMGRIEIQSSSFSTKHLSVDLEIWPAHCSGDVVWTLLWGTRYYPLHHLERHRACVHRICTCGKVGQCSPLHHSKFDCWLVTSLFWKTSVYNCMPVHVTILSMRSMLRVSNLNRFNQPPVEVEKISLRPVAHHWV